MIFLSSQGVGKPCEDSLSFENDDREFIFRTPMIISEMLSLFRCKGFSFQDLGTLFPKIFETYDQ
jgi:hypothetical protein